VLALTVALALVVGACSGTGGGNAESGFGYVLDEAPGGYSLCSVNLPSGLSVTSNDDATLRVYGDGRLDDPYAGPLYGVAAFSVSALADLDLGNTVEVVVGGAIAWLGGADGLQLATLPEGAGRTLTWEVDGRVVQLVVRNDETVDLVALAASVEVSDAGAVLAAPEGFIDLGDLFELEGRTSFLFSIFYELEGGDGSDDDNLTLLGVGGDEASMEAFRFRALSSEAVSVAGDPGVGADMGSGDGGPIVVSWLLEEGVVLRLFSFSIAPGELIDQAQKVRRVEGDEWQALAERHAAGCLPKEESAPAG